MSVEYRKLTKAQLEEANFFPLWSKEKIESCIREMFGDKEKPQCDYLRAYLVNILLAEFNADINIGMVAAHFLDGWDAANDSGKTKQ